MEVLERLETRLDDGENQELAASERRLKVPYKNQWKTRRGEIHTRHRRDSYSPPASLQNLGFISFLSYLNYVSNLVNIRVHS